MPSPGPKSPKSSPSSRPRPVFPLDSIHQPRPGGPGGRDWSIGRPAPGPCWRGRTDGDPDVATAARDPGYAGARLRGYLFHCAATRAWQTDHINCRQYRRPLRPCYRCCILVRPALPALRAAPRNCLSRTDISLGGSCIRGYRHSAWCTSRGTGIHPMEPLSDCSGADLGGNSPRVLVPWFPQSRSAIHVVPGCHISVPSPFPAGCGQEAARAREAGFQDAPKLLRFGLPSALTSLPQTINLRLDQLLIIAFLPPVAGAVRGRGGVERRGRAPPGGCGIRVVPARLGGARTHAASTLAEYRTAGWNPRRDSDLCGLRGARTLGLPVVFGARFSGAVPAALILVPAGAILAWSGIAENGLQGLGRPAIVLAAELTGAAVTLGALPLLLHDYGIVGAALASLLGYASVAAFAVTAIRRSTDCGIRSLMIPTWPVTKSLVVRCAALVRLAPRAVGRHRPRSTS